ncbi:MAG: butyrate kinase, partial [Spirochaeta sp.]|nr:butyrate kinase [Spirochaeta sp.]
MERNFRILAINPGSTSTKISCFSGMSGGMSGSITVEMEAALTHSAAELERYPRMIDQLAFRREAVRTALADADIPLASLDAVVGRGGLVHPIPGGTYAVNDVMVADLTEGVLGEHASNLGGILAREIADAAGGRPAYIVDPVVVDELVDDARMSGSPQIPRVSIFHALNQKATARRAASELGRPYEDCRLIVAHMGGGISVGAHSKGRVIDVNNALNGEGPFSPERSGTLPAGQLAELCFSGTREKPEIMKMLKGAG